MASSSRFSEVEEEKITEIIDEIKDSWPLNVLVFICFSLVHCFLIQTGRAGSHCKSIASSELRLNITRDRDC